MQKKLSVLLVCFCLVCGMLSGCGGPVYEDTFLSELLADTSIDLTETGVRELESFCDSQDVPMKEVTSYYGRAFEITDLFLDYDAVYKLDFELVVTRDEKEYLVMDAITVDVKFETEKEVDSGLSQIKQHIASKIGAAYNVSDDVYKLFINENDETCAYAKITCGVEKEKTAVIRIDFEFFPEKDAEVIKAFINKVPSGYFANNCRCTMIKPSEDEAAFLMFEHTNPITIYRYDNGTVEEIRNEVIRYYGMKFLANNQIALEGVLEDAGKYGLYSYEDGVLTLEKNIDKKTYDSYSSIQWYSYDSISEAYSKIIDWEEEAKGLQKKDIMKSYVKYMNDEFGVEAHGAKYRFVDLDSDGIMELLYDCPSSAAGMGILSYYDGKVIDNHLEDGAFKYMEGNNKIFHDYGRMGYYGSRIFRLEKGEVITEIEGEYNEVVIDGEFDYEYTLGGESVTSGEYSTYFKEILSEGKWIEFSSYDSNLKYNDLYNEIEKMN